MGSSDGSNSKESSCNAEDLCLIPGSGRSPVFLPGECHGQREPGGLLTTGLQSVRHDWWTNTSHSLHTQIHGLIGEMMNVLTILILAISL